MVLLLSVLLLFYQADDLPAAKLSAIDFAAVKQGKVEIDQGCFDFYSRQISFRVKNRSDKTIYIYGSKTNRYYPFGNLIRLDSEKNQWVNSLGNASHLSYKEFMAGAPVGDVPDVYVLPPGKSMKFYDLAEAKFLGSRVKRVTYISLGQNEEPQLMTSEEFTLR
jgi:hypothetical protein